MAKAVAQLVWRQDIPLGQLLNLLCVGEIGAIVFCHNLLKWGEEKPGLWQFTVAALMLN